MIFHRLNQIKNFLNKNQLDGFLISNFFNILYLSNFKTLTENEREAWMLINKKNSHLITDLRYQVLLENKHIRTLFIQPPEKRLLNIFEEIINQEGLKKIAFEADDLKVNEFQFFYKNLSKLQVNFYPYEKIIIHNRSIKDKKEIALIKKACQITDQCLTDISKIIKKGLTEKEIAFKIEYWLKEKGCDLAFYPIVAIDKNSAIPHYDTRENGQEKVKNNSIILIDFGVKYKNYLSDITRMFFYGKPSAEQVSVYQKLLSIQEKTINFSQKNFFGRDLDQFCRNLYDKELLPKCSHSIGHGVGLEIHEYPKINFVSEEIITNNQVFTIEPGVYFENKWGMRIEDTVIYQNKIISLTKFDKKLIII